MANIIVVVPLTMPSDPVASRGSGAGNLRDPDPKLVFQDSATTSMTISVDYGADVSFDTVALIGTNAAAGATWTITYSTNAQGATYASTFQSSTNMRQSDASGPPYNCLAHRSAGAVTARYLRLTIVQGGSTNLYAGGLVVGPAFKPTYNYEWGSGRGLATSGSKERLIGGGFARVPGAVFGKFKWTLGDLSDTETLALYRALKTVGDQEPILVVEDPAATTGLSEGTHWGILDAIEEYERQNPSQNKWAFTIEEWV